MYIFCWQKLANLVIRIPQQPSLHSSFILDQFLWSKSANTPPTKCQLIKSEIISFWNLRMVRTVQEPLPTTPHRLSLTGHSQPPQQNNVSPRPGKPRSVLQERSDNVILPSPKPQGQKGKAQAFKTIPKLVNRPSRSPMRPKVSKFVANSPQRVRESFSSPKSNPPLSSLTEISSHAQPRPSMPMPAYIGDETLLIDMSLPGDSTLGAFETTDESEDETMTKMFGGFKGLMTPDNSQEVVSY